MSREAENTLLLLVGVATAMIAFTGAFTRYVKDSMLPWLVVSAVVILGLALVSIAVDVRRGAPVQHEHDGHPPHRSPAALLLVPVVLLIFITPPAMRPDAAPPQVSAVSTDALRRAFPPLPPGRAPEVSVPDVMMRAAQDTAGSLDNRLITVIGFTLIEPDGVDLGRIAIRCCAADAQLARIHLRGPEAEEVARLPDQTWIRVEGKIVSAEADGDSTSIPTMEITSATEIDPPANTYA